MKDLFLTSAQYNFKAQSLNNKGYQQAQIPYEVTATKQGKTWYLVYHGSKDVTGWKRVSLFIKSLAHIIFTLGIALKNNPKLRDHWDTALSGKKIREIFVDQPEEEDVNSTDSEDEEAKPVEQVLTKMDIEKVTVETVLVKKDIETKSVEIISAVFINEIKNSLCNEWEIWGATQILNKHKNQRFKITDEDIASFKDLIIDAEKRNYKLACQANRRGTVGEQKYIEAILDNFKYSKDTFMEQINLYRTGRALTHDGVPNKYRFENFDSWYT